MTRSALDLTTGRLDLAVWSDPVIDRLGHDPRSAYAEEFWLGILGPSAMWFLRLSAKALDGGADDLVVPIDVAEAAASIGMSWNGGRHAPFTRMLDRTMRFGATRALDPHTLAIRRRLPPLTARQTDRLPERLRRRHQLVDEHPSMRESHPVERSA